MLRKWISPRTAPASVAGSAPTAILTTVMITVLLVLGSASQVMADDIKDLKKDFAKAMNAQDESTAIDILGRIADVGGEDALEELYDIGFQHATTPELYKAALSNLGRMDGILEFVKERYDKVDSRGDFRERVYIADITAGISGKEAIEQLGVYLSDKAPFVQSAAVEHLEKSQSAAAIEPLIDLLAELVKKRKDVLYHQVRDALWTLTGNDFEVIEDWRVWWEPNKGSFDPKASDHEGKTGVKRKRRGDDPDFWGVPVESKNIVFVIDTSGSMRYVQKDDIPGLARGDGSDTGGSSGGGQMTKEQQDLAEFWTRMEMAKRELKRVVRKLDKDALFNCVQFDTTVSRFKKTAAPATRGTKSKATEWTETLRHRGNTATLDALVEAFNADVRTNTIYFLSDGLPSKDGKANDPTRPILDKLFEMNRFRKIKIHTFGFDPSRQTPGWPPSPDLIEANKWLEELAKATGGTFTLMKVDPRRTPDNPDGDID